MEKKESYRSLLEMGPLILFFGVNYFYVIFAGTAVLVISTIIALIISWYFFKNIPMLAAFGCLAVVLFGGLIKRDPHVLIVYTTQIESSRLGFCEQSVGALNFDSEGIEPAFVDHPVLRGTY